MTGESWAVAIRIALLVGVFAIIGFGYANHSLLREILRRLR